MGGQIETRIGSLKFALTFFICGIGGNLASAVFLPTEVSVASLSTLSGISAFFVHDLIVNERSHPDKYRSSAILIVGLLIAAFIGITPTNDQLGTFFRFCVGLDAFFELDA